LRQLLVATAVCLLAAAACSREVRKDATPPLGPDAVASAVREAARADPGAGPELSAAEQIEHALARTTFGPRQGDRERIARIGIAAFLEEQLHPERIDDARVDAELNRFTVLSRSTGDLAQELTQARDRFAAGVANNIEVVQAQQSVTTADEQYIDALLGFDVSKAVLARSLGDAEAAVQRILGAAVP